MIEVCQYVALVMEAAEQVVGVHAALQHLDRDQFAELIVIAHGLEHGAHAALADFLHHAIDAQPLAGRGRFGGGQRGPFQELAGLCMRREQGFDFDAQMSATHIARASAGCSSEA